MLTIVPSVLSAMGLSEYVRGAVETVCSPFQYAFTYITNAIDGYAAYFREFDRISEENRQMKEELSSLKDKLYSAELVEEENKWLRSYIGLRREHIDYVFEDASLIGREAGNYITVFTLNRGTLHGVAVGMPVVTEDGVVGQITEVGANWSKAATLLESASAVGVYVERSGQLALLDGDYELAGNGVCRLSYLPENADIKVGDRVVTSGLGSVYPRGLMVGEVSEITTDEYSRGLVATVTPYAELDSLKKVMIIKSYDIYVGDETSDTSGASGTSDTTGASGTASGGGGT